MTVPLPRRHRHFYQVIGAQHKGTWPGVGPETVVAYRCMCHTPEQLLLVSVPGRWTVDDLTTPDWPPLISRARAQRLGELASVRELHGDEADALLDPVLPDWRHVAGVLASELGGFVRAGDGTTSDALRQYGQAVRIQAEQAADAASGTDWAAQPARMYAKVFPGDDRATAALLVDALNWIAYQRGQGVSNPGMGERGKRYEEAYSALVPAARRGTLWPNPDGAGSHD
jgi:hypothetical protein